MTAPVLTRQGFLRIGIAWIGASTLPFGLGCPADDTGDDGAGSGSDGSGGGNTTTAADGESTAAGASCENDPSVMITANHGHVLMVPLADVMAGVEVTYDIQGTADHAHTVTLDADHFAMLEQGIQVTVASSFAGHNHQVTVACA